MLILSRRRSECIMINDDIMIMVTDIFGDKVRIGIDAPREYTVHREEVYRLVKEEERQRLEREKGE